SAATSIHERGRNSCVKHEQNTRRCACLAGCNSTAGAHPASGRRGLLSIRYLWLFALFTAGTDEKESDQTVRKSPRRPTVSIPDPGTRRGGSAVRVACLLGLRTIAGFGPTVGDVRADHHGDVGVEVLGSLGGRNSQRLGDELRLGGVVLTLVVDGRVREVRRVVADLPERPALVLDGLGELLRCPGHAGAVEDVDGDRVVGDADFALTRRGFG